MRTIASRDEQKTWKTESAPPNSLLPRQFLCCLAWRGMWIGSTIPSCCWPRPPPSHPIFFSMELPMLSSPIGVLSPSIYMTQNGSNNECLLCGLGRSTILRLLVFDWEMVLSTNLFPFWLLWQISCYSGTTQDNLRPSVRFRNSHVIPGLHLLCVHLQIKLLAVLINLDITVIQIVQSSECDQHLQEKGQRKGNSRARCWLRTSWNAQFPFPLPWQML